MVLLYVRLEGPKVSLSFLPMDQGIFPLILLQDIARKRSPFSLTLSPEQHAVRSAGIAQTVKCLLPGILAA